MMNLCPVKWTRDPCLPAQDICRHGHISAEVGSIETFPSLTLPRPRTPAGGSDTCVRNWHVPFGIRIPHAVSMRLKMEKCNIWDMPADSMHEPPSILLLGGKISTYTSPHPCEKFWKGRKLRHCTVLCIRHNRLLPTVESCLMHSRESRLGVESAQKTWFGHVLYPRRLDDLGMLL